MKLNDAQLVEKLAPFINDTRKARIEAVLEQRLSSVQLAIENPSDINNALAAVRTAEAFGIANIHIIAPEGEAGSTRLITQGAFYWVNIYFYQSLDEFLAQVKGFKLAGGALPTPDPRLPASNTQLTLSQLPIDHPICLIVGNEQRGLSEAAKQACDWLYKIPMVGMSESLNLSVSAAISLYDVTTRKRAQLDSSSDLSEAQQMALRSKYYQKSVNGRLVAQLLKNQD